MMSKTPPQPKTISRLFDAVYPPFALLAGMELDVFTPLAEGPLSADQIANNIGVKPVKLRPLLYTLVVAGLLTVEEGLFSNTPEANHYLVRNKPAYLGDLQGLTSGNWARILQTGATIRKGGPLEQFDYHDMPQDELVTFFRGLYPGALEDAARLMNHFDFSNCNTLLDVGGGSGGLAIAIAQANPQLRATIIDLPLVTPITQRFVDEAQVSNQIEIISADAIHDTLAGTYDVIVARHVIQVLSEDDSRALLRNLATVLKPGGIIYLLGWVLDDSRLTPQNTVYYNLVLLNAYEDGQAYTEQEYGSWLTEAGFVDFERILKPDGASIVTARKPA